jgi:hypothetical protein
MARQLREDIRPSVQAGNGGIIGHSDFVAVIHDKVVWLL